jgi:hypothetical protein
VSAYFSFDFTIIILFSSILHYFRIFETIPLKIYLIILFSFGPQLCESNILENVMAENPGAKQPPSNRPHNKPPRSALGSIFAALIPRGKICLCWDEWTDNSSHTQYCDVRIRKKEGVETIIVLKK